MFKYNDRLSDKKVDSESVWTRANKKLYIWTKKWIMQVPKRS